MKQISMEKKFGYTAVMDSEGGFTAGIVEEGELGYFATDWHWKTDYATAQKICDERNLKMGLDKKDVAMLVLASMRSRGKSVPYNVVKEAD